MLPVDILEGIEKNMSKIQKRPACLVDIRNLDKEDKRISKYLSKDQLIVFNSDYYDETPEIEIMGALFYEIRHAYQYHIINSEDTNQESKEVIDHWKSIYHLYGHSFSCFNEFDFDENSNLLQEEVYGIHSFNIEVDALAYADLNIYHIYKVHLPIPKHLKKLVIKRQKQIKDRDDIIKM